MSEQEWRTVAELIQSTETIFDQTFVERLAAAVSELNLPRSVLKRLQQAVSAAVGRTFQGDNAQAAGVIILTRELSPEASGLARSWGFFLINRGAEDGTQYQIEVFLYPDGS